MSDDALAVWLDGYDTPAGYLVRDAAADTAFYYDQTYTEAGGPPLSLSLPLTQRDYGDVETRAFFDNLLPENNQLDEVMARHGLARSDVVGLLRHMGADCSGAISCLPIGDPPVKTPGILAEDYEPLDDKLLGRIVKSLAEAQRLPAEVHDPSPVAGVQRKIALTMLPGRIFALPRKGLRVPTTHILKVPERRHGNDARHEEAAALLAQAAGLDVSIPQAIKVDGYDALLVERFDRRVSDGVVTRIHQEDFAQALGFPAALKYQRNGEPGRWFDVKTALSVLDRTQDPEAAYGAFLLATLFNLCIGNTDNHAKNHALLYDAGPVPHLAPLYDLLPIRLDNRYHHRLAYRIGAAETFDDMTPGDLDAFFAIFGLENPIVVAEQIVAPLIASLEAATQALRAQQLKRLDDLIGRETEQLAELLALSIEVRERDAFHAGGGGWRAGS
jgi:serine/threonine-protein kinase HipA